MGVTTRATKQELYDLAEALLEELALAWEDEYKDTREWPALRRRLEEFEQTLKNGWRA